jgi:MFS family permease
MLRRNPDFIKLLSAQTISTMGTWITGTALPLTALLVLGASPGEMGLLVAVEGAPILLVSLVAGAWVDRLRRRPLLITADLARAALLATIPAAYLLGVLAIQQLYIVAALVGILSVFFDVADQSYLPTLVERNQIMDANSKLSVSSSTAEIVAPGLGGTLVQLLSAPIAILFDAASFLLSALLVGLIRKPEPPPTLHTEPNMARDIAEGLRLVLGHPVLRAMALSSATSSFFGGFIGTLYLLFGIRDLGLGPALIGALIGLGGLSSVVGALLVRPITQRFGIGPTLVGSAVVGSILCLPIPLAGGSVLLAAAALASSQLFGDASGTIHRINEVTLRQTITPDRLLGRANASTHFLVGGVGPIGALVGGVLAEVIGVRTTLFVAVAGIMLSVLWLVFSPIPAIREQPAQLA